MKYLILCLMTVLFATSAYAFGPWAKDSGGVVKLNAFVPDKAKSGCTTIAKGRATAVTVPASSSMQMGWQAVDATGTGVIVKRSFDSNTANMSSTGEANLGLGATTKNVVFTRYTGATTITLCYDKQ